MCGRDMSTYKALDSILFLMHQQGDGRIEGLIHALKNIQLALCKEFFDALYLRERFSG